MLTRIFSRTPFVLLNLRAPDGPVTGGGAPVPAAPPEPQGATLEDKLTNAISLIGDWFKKAGASAAALATAQAENARLQGQFDAATATGSGLAATLNGVRAELATAQAGITTLTGERDTAKTDLVTANGNITRLEKLCNLNGVDPKAAIPAPVVESNTKSTVAEWERKMKAAKTPQDRAKVSAAFEKAVTDGNVASAEPLSL